jgi:hypothetical protein
VFLMVDLQMVSRSLTITALVVVVDHWLVYSLGTEIRVRSLWLEFV